jgi:DNA repair photolyase
MAGVVYRELPCKSVLNRVHGMPFRWSINPYRGCAHSCHYCFARKTHTYLDLDAGDDFSGIIFAKVDAPRVLRCELSRPCWRHEEVALGSATDPYQPAEGRFRITRGILEALFDYYTPVTIVTKGTLILRDRDLLAALAARAGCTVCLSVPTVDRAIWRATEPGTAPPMQRLRAMEQLAAAGVRAGVLAAPILPGLSGTVERLEEMVRAAAAHGACFLWAGLLHLGPLVRDHYFTFLRNAYPEVVDLHCRLYPSKYASLRVRDRLDRRIEDLKAQYGLVDQPRAQHTPPRPQQMELAFSRG